ncbi:hypothetical protein EDB80DRAFT_136288 [Ilyonectria destructans]|nr:hypothetical protein EDB80DRAFT_136288 [Ilyonectria destructans]
MRTLLDGSMHCRTHLSPRCTHKSTKSSHLHLIVILLLARNTASYHRHFYSVAQKLIPQLCSGFGLVVAISGSPLLVRVQGFNDYLVFVDQADAMYSFSICCGFIRLVLRRGRLQVFHSPFGPGILIHRAATCNTDHQAWHDRRYRCKTSDIFLFRGAEPAMP